MSQLVKLVVLCCVLSACRAEEDYFKHFFDDNLEEIEDAPLEFKPKPVPDWLRGSYIRNGIGQLRTKKRRMKHIFDGFTKLTKIHFSDKSTFTTKFIRSHLYNDSQALGDVAPYQLFKGTIPPYTPYEGMKSILNGFDNMNVNVMKLEGAGPEYLALNDIWTNYQFTENLDTVRKVEEPVPGLSKIWTKLSVMSTAHPVQEYGSNDQINIVSTLNPLGGGWMSLVRIKSITNRQLIARWPVHRLPYLHSFALSKNYAVLVCTPTYLNLAGLLKYWEPVDGLVIEKDDMTRIFIVDIHNGEVKEIQKKDTGFMMHFINAHETEDGQIVMDATVHDTMAVLADIDLDTMLDKELRNKRSEKYTTSHAVTRLIVDLNKMDIEIMKHNVTKGKEFVLGMEMPTINENYRHKANCFVYGTASNVGPDSSRLVKKDLCNKQRDLVWGRKDHYPTEPWFVATPGGRSEDDGLLISLIMEGATQRSYVLLLDAKTMTEYSKAYLTTTVPWGLHGRFFYDNDGHCTADGKCQ